MSRTGERVDKISLFSLYQIRVLVADTLQPALVSTGDMTLWRVSSPDWRYDLMRRVSRSHLISAPMISDRAECS